MNLRIAAKQSALLRGTLLLTATGLITRFIGFFYRIYLSNTLGAELLGIYQLIFPVFGICFTIYGSGIQTAISKVVSENRARGTKILSAGMSLSILFALCLTFLLTFSCKLTAEYFLNEPRCAESLRYLALLFPFCGISACIHGYCYGIGKPFLPATSQLVEQLARIISLIIFVLVYPLSCELAVMALVAGEVGGCLYCLIGVRVLQKRLITVTGPSSDNASSAISSNTVSPDAVSLNALSPNAAISPVATSSRNEHFEPTKELLRISTPLTMNRLLVSLLHSFEASLVPLFLRNGGFSRSEALSTFGIITGMTMAFLMFPGTLTNSLSVLLLPSISSTVAAGRTAKLKQDISVTTKYSLLLGLFACFYFFFFGKPLGLLVFHEERAGIYLAQLSILCPVLYVSTTFSSILNGLGKITQNLITTIAGLSLRLVLFAVWIPSHQVTGYLMSLILSQIVITWTQYYLIERQIVFHLSFADCLLKPILILFALAGMFSHLYRTICSLQVFPPLLTLGFFAFLFSGATLVSFKLSGLLER